MHLSNVYKTIGKEDYSKEAYENAVNLENHNMLPKSA